MLIVLKTELAFEIEWNNKDPFFDRDLNNFRLLFDLRAISIGIIITRCDELQEIFKELEQRSSRMVPGQPYGEVTATYSREVVEVVVLFYYWE